MPTDLENAVEEARVSTEKISGVVPSVVNLIHQMADEAANNADEPAKIRELSVVWNQHADALAAAVANPGSGGGTGGGGTGGEPPVEGGTSGRRR